MPNPTFPFMWYDNELWDLPENWLGLFWLNSILFFLWQNVQPQTTLSPHPSSALMIFTSTFILPAGTCHNSTIKNKNNPEVKRKLPTTSSTTQTVNHLLWHHSWKKNQDIQLLLLGKYSSAQGTLLCFLPGSLSVHPLPQSGVSKRHKQKLSRPLSKECSWRYSVDGLDVLSRYSVMKILPVIQPGLLKEFHLFITRTKLKISYKPSLHHKGHYGDGKTFMNS